MFDLTDRRAVVTGASSGIGQAIAIAFAQAGANVASLSLTAREGAAETETAIRAAGREAIMLEGSTADRSQVDALAEAVDDAWGGIDIWVNNAGQLLVRHFVDITDEEWHGLLGTNIHGYFHGCQAAARRMVAQGHGRIINVTSVTRQQPSSDISAYITTKAAIHGLTVSLAVELAPHGVTVNAIAPGATHTAMSGEVFTSEVRRQYEARIPVGRIAEPSDLAGAAVFLASDEASYVTGHEVLVDGAMVLNGNVSFVVD